MPLNKQKGNMYGFVTHTWNAIKGACPHQCEYCYMKKWGKLSKLHFDESELKTDLGSGNFIFVGSSCDMFADNIPEEWIIKTLQHCENYKNEYLFQSKNVEKLLEYNSLLPRNSTICTTMETNCAGWNYKAPTISERYLYLRDVKLPIMISIEPIIDFWLKEFVFMIKSIEPIQVNIGANTNSKVKLPEPPKEKLLEFISELEKFTKVYQKDNLKRLLK